MVPLVVALTRKLSSIVKKTVSLFSAGKRKGSPPIQLTSMRSPVSRW